MRSPARRLLLAAVLVAAASSTFSASAPAQPTSTDATRRGGPVAEFRSDLFAFRYPSRWEQFEFPGSFHFHPLVYVSTQPGHDPCRQTSSSATVCGWPVDRLRPDGVVIVWTMGYLPLGSFASVPGRTLRVGGRSAKRVITRPGRCSGIGADETLDVTIQLSTGGNWMAMTACMRGPDLPAREREIEALLASTRFLVS